jgi:hypothetical protein
MKIGTFLIILCNAGFIFGQDMYHNQEELRRRKHALNIATAFVNDHQSGTGKKQLTKREHRT